MTDEQHLHELEARVTELEKWQANLQGRGYVVAFLVTIVVAVIVAGVTRALFGA